MNWQHKFKSHFSVWLVGSLGTWLSLFATGCSLHHQTGSVAAGRLAPEEVSKSVATNHSVKPPAPLSLVDTKTKINGDDILSKGQAVFSRTCQLCHQTNGLGLANQFPPLAGSEWILAPDPCRIISIVLYGLMGPVHVKGQQWSAQMPPLGMVLSDDDIAAALTYVRQAWENNAAAVSPDRVRAMRQKIGTRTQAWSVEELLQISEGNPIPKQNTNIQVNLSPNSSPYE